MLRGERVTGSLAHGAGRPARRPGQRLFIAGLGVGQIVSWGTFYYSFPLIAGPMAEEFAMTKPEVYGAATVGLLVASLAAYPVGAAVDRGHGRLVMALGSLLGGLLLIAWASIGQAWMLYPLFAGIGLVQAMTLYDPAFAVIARRLGAEARGGITALTLWGGFASTVFVPAVQFLLDHAGWRDALLALAAVNLLLCVTLHLSLIDSAAWPAAGMPQAGAPSSMPEPAREGVGWALRQPAFWGLLVAFTVYYGTFSGLTYHLYPMLMERGFDTASVVGAIAVIGPAQVAGRVFIWLLASGRPIRLVGSVTVAAFPVALAILMFLPEGFATLAAFALVYGAGNGIITIVRALAVPEMLTRNAYGAINGALSVPAMAAKAAAPFGAAALWSFTGSYDAVLAAAFAATLVIAGGFWSAALASRRSGV
nr:MFS transporter [Azospirillum sp. SYSU D00513]